MKSFLQAFEDSATSRIFDKENSILLFESKYTLKSTDTSSDVEYR
jgi:hypothetical protein